MIGPLAQAGRLQSRAGHLVRDGRPNGWRKRPTWSNSSVVLADIQFSGEVGLLAAKRGLDGLPAPVDWRSVPAPRGVPGGIDGAVRQCLDRGEWC